MDERTRPGEPTLPPYMEKLPRDHRGFVVPWFVPKMKATGEWNFQAVDPRRVAEAVQRNVCWICGKPLRKNLAFVAGPMCVVSRVSSEPPSHVECATYAVQVCPFLTKPRMRRAPSEEAIVPGIMIERNPGVCALWVVRRMRPFRTATGGPGLLFRVLEPTVRISCWAEGRKATQAEIEHSLVTGLPSLEAIAREDDAHNKNTGSSEELARLVAAARQLLGLPQGVTT